MSDTRRHCDHGWNLSNPDFVHWSNGKIKSDKHQQKDRPSQGNKTSGKYRLKQFKHDVGKEKHIMIKEFEKKKFNEEIKGVKLEK